MLRHGGSRAIQARQNANPELGCTAVQRWPSPSAPASAATGTAYSPDVPFRPFNDLVDDAKRTITEIDCDELAELLDPANDVPDLVVIDIREADERARGHIPGSIGLPRGILDRDIAKVVFGGAVADHQLARPIVLCCAGGSRSALAAVSLRAMGFTNVQSLAGGFGAWGKSGRPVEHPRSH